MTVYLSGLQEFGDIKKSLIVVVAQGNELHMLLRQNSAAYPDVHEPLKALADQRATSRVWANLAYLRHYKPGEFHDEVTAGRAGRNYPYRQVTAPGQRVHFRGNHRPEQAARVSAQAPLNAEVSAT